MHLTDISNLPEAAAAARMANRPAGSDDRSIGAILIDAGLLRSEDAERILLLQKEQGLRFGEAAIKLGLVTEQDLRFALSSQFQYPYLQAGKSRLDADVVAAYAPFSSRVESLRVIRSQLLLRWFTNGDTGRALAVVSPERGDGRSWLAANLAVVFSQLGERTLLIDADLRNSRQHKLFGVDNAKGLSTVLTGRDQSAAIQRVDGLRDLSLLPAGPTPPNPQELLSRTQFGELIAMVSGSFDVVIVDTAAADGSADAQLTAARCGGALLATRRNRTRLGACKNLTDSVLASGASLVGAVLSEV